MTAAQPRVLLVDDDRSLLRLLSMRLSAAGYGVLAVESGENVSTRNAAFASRSPE